MDTNLKNNDEITDINDENNTEYKEDSVNDGDAVIDEDQVITEADKTIKADNKNKKSFSGNLMITLMILVFTVVSVGVYSPLKNIIFKNNGITEYLESHKFAYSLANITGYVSYNKLSADSRYYDSAYDEMQNIKYYIRNTNTGEWTSNIKDFNEFRLEKERTGSRFYLHGAIDEEGRVTITDLIATSFHKESFVNALVNSYENEESRFANLEIIFIVPEKLSAENDLLISDMKNAYLERLLILILLIGGISILTLIIIAFAIPFKKHREVSIVNFYNKIYLEFKLLLWFAILMLDFAIVHVVNFNFYRNSDCDLAAIVYDAGWQFYALGVPITFILYYFIYLTVCNIKYIYHVGIVEGLLKRTVLGNLFAYIAKTIKDTAITLIEIDDKNKFREKLIMLLGINFLALVIISFTFHLGRIFALIYSIVLFKYSIKVLEKLRILNKTSEELSKGNFNTVLPEDMGILSPFSKNLNMIKEGFQIAVDKEVKSQSMKTELISNVSHDLKTPLTSIITYIDLLKTNALDDETRAEYLDVLDKKSIRLKALIDDLFDISKANSGNIDLYLEKLDVVALLRQTLGELEEKILESGLIMRINLPEHKVICELDGRRTYRIFENIMSNIFKYSMPNSRVYIDGEEKEDSISLVFRNIAAYEMNFDSKDITDRFTRGDASRNTDGSGLGLAIARSLTELQKGSLSVSVDGDLFKLTVSFPKLENL